MKIKASLLLLLLFPGVSQAVDFSGLDLDPMVRVKSQVTAVTSPPGPADIHDDSTYFVTRGGATVFVLVTQVIDSQTGRTVHHIGRGISSPEPLARLKHALVAARAGVRTSCLFDRPDSPTDTYEITWYGRNARQNQFTIVFGPAGPATLPACPVEVSELIGAIGSYEIQVLNDPESEVLSNE